LISDASHAQGALWDGKPLGFYYDYVCASLGKGKLISGGELGVVTARDDRCRDRMLLYGHVNRVPKAFLTEEYRHIANAVGVKYRPHAFALALALTQIQTYPERSRRLVQHIQAFEAGLARIPGCAPYSTPTAADRVYWRIPLRIDPQLDPADLVARLQERDGPVERAPGTLVPHHSAITEYYGIKPQRRFPVADQVAARTVRVHPFPLYIEGAVEELLAAFEEVFRS
jgi:dTDP-4-amino-4,6-dideoxygalactose transaminase